MEEEKAEEQGPPPDAPVEISEAPPDKGPPPPDKGPPPPDKGPPPQTSQFDIVVTVDLPPVPIGKRQVEPSDWKDYSYDPSYAKFEVPYNMQCRDRYHKYMQKYEHQIQYEIHQIMLQQSSAFEAARLVRHLAFTTLWPPMHNRTELVRTQRYFFHLTPKEQQRLNQIMSTKY